MNSLRSATRPSNRAARALATALCLWLALPAPARPQGIEPRAYANAPVGVNFLIGGYAYTEGSLEFNSLPLTDASLQTSNALLAYARSLDLWGLSGKFDVVVPYVWLSGSAQYRGEPVQRVVNGPGDPTFRFSVNLYGAPAMNLEEFAHYRQDLIVGASVRVWVPLGQYDPSRLVNIGTHRWAIKPEVGISKAIGKWTLEAQAAVTFYTDNHDFYGGHTRSQDPLFSLQGHVIYGFDNGVWASLDATWFAGGRSTLDGVLSSDLQQNWRAGGTLAFPVDRYHSIKLFASNGVAARTGNNYDLIGIAWQTRWGGGL